MFVLCSHPFQFFRSYAVQLYMQSNWLHLSTAEFFGRAFYILSNCQTLWHCSGCPSSWVDSENVPQKQEIS